MKKIVLFGLFLISVGCLNKVDQEKVIAKVGPTVYSVDDINDRINNLDPQLKEYFTKKENKVRLLDQLIEEEVIYQLAKKDGLQRSKDFKKTVSELKRQALINYYIQQKIDRSSEVTRSEVESFYNENGAQFASYESRNLSHILVATKSDARKVVKKLNNGQSFEALAKQYSIDPSKDQGGQLGWIRKEQLVPEFSNAAYKLTKKSPISGIVKSQFGYHIIQFNDTKTVPARDLDAVYSQISEQLLAQKKREKFTELLKNGKETVKIERSIENLN
ncbi:MAG: peptidylprolyl isomerase [Candidatus Marinamargulisbacteria bacterium]